MSLVSPSPLIGYNQKKKSMNLPRIEHPSKRFDDHDKGSLDIRGRSRDGYGDGKIIRNEISTPESPQRRRRSSSLKLNSNSYPSKYSQSLSEIPENVDTIYGEDRDKVRLPVFGRRPDSTTSSIEEKKENDLTSRISIDELESTLRDKVRSQLHDVRSKFRHASDNDPNGKLSRQALKHLIGAIFGTQRQIGPNQIDKLLERLHLKDSNKISFDEFIESLFSGEEELPQWISRQISPREESTSKRTAAQIFVILKDKIRNKNKDLINLCPSLNGGPSSRIFKAQFYNALVDMGYKMKDTEFDKLWDKFDTDGFKAVHSDKFVKCLTNEAVGEETGSIKNREEQDDQSSLFHTKYVRSSHSNSELKTPRQTSRGQLDENQIQTWLNHKFPQGYSDLERSLERLDTKQMGTLPRDRFLEELKRYGLKLEPTLLDFFLKKLDVDLTLTSGGVPYHDVINAFKQRSDPTRKRINADNQLHSDESRQTSMERQIDFALSMNYERVRDILNRLDVSHNGTISANEIRSIIEDLIEYPLKADEYYQLLKQIPMDENGRVIYKEYLKQVLDRTLYLQEQHQQKQKVSSKSPQREYIKPTNLRDKISPEQLKRKKRETENDFNRNSFDNNDEQKARSLDQLRELMKTIIRNRYKDIEDEFKKLDRSSYGELTQDLLFDLLKRLGLKPLVTREEIDLLWSRCHLKENGHLDFYQFLREFGYSKRSAHYPNAKKNPPRRGDADSFLTSRKLYGDSVLVHGTALNAIKSNWDELRREFTELDPYRTSFVQSDEFDDILTELCPSVNQEDLDILKHRFQTKTDSRMNYVKFLKHHAPAPEFIGLIDQSNTNPLPAINEKSARVTSDRSLGNQLSNKLRRKLSDSHKEIRRLFKQRDSTNTGSVPVQVFKEILNQFKCSLNDEEFYTLTSQIDTKMDGTIDYNYFLIQYVKNN